MKAKHFAISLAAAGYLPQEGLAFAQFMDVDDWDKSTALFQVFKGEHRYTLAGHRSHSSHGSHGSHGSHRSSTGGGVPVPSAPRSNSTTPQTVLPSLPSAPTPLPGNSAKFTLIVMEVQTALYALGYYTGAIDGVVGPQTVTALSKYQKEWGLTVNGRITPEVLDALGISAN